MAVLKTWAPTGVSPENYEPAAFTNAQEDQVNIQSLDTTGTGGQVPAARPLTLELVATVDLLIRTSAGGFSYLLPAFAVRTFDVRDPRALTSIFVQGLTAGGTLYARKI